MESGRCIFSALCSGWQKHTYMSQRENHHIGAVDDHDCGGMICNDTILWEFI